MGSILASGCLIILLLLSWADAISVLFAIATFAAIGAACFAVARRMSAERGPPLAGFRWLGRRGRPVILAAVLGLIAVGNAALPPTTPSDTPLGGYLGGLVLLISEDSLDLTPPELMRWNTFSRVKVSPTVGRPELWGASPMMPTIATSQRRMNIDGDAATVMHRFDGEPSKLDFLRYDVTNLAYTIRHQGRSAVIGVGAGRTWHGDREMFTRRYAPVQLSQQQ